MAGKRNVPPSPEEQKQIEAQLAAMLDAAKSLKDSEGFESYGSDVVGWAGLRVTSRGTIAGKDEDGMPYPVIGKYRGLFELAVSRDNPYYYVIELTKPTFINKKDEDGNVITVIGKPGERIGYGVRKTLDLTGMRDGDIVSIMPMRKDQTDDGRRDYWLFDVGRIPAKGAPAAPNAKLAPPKPASDEPTPF